MRSTANPQVRFSASSAFVYTNAQNGLPALPPKVRFCSLGQHPKPFEQPPAGAGCAFDSRTLVRTLHQRKQPIKGSILYSPDQKAIERELKSRFRSSPLSSTHHEAYKVRWRINQAPALRFRFRPFLYSMPHLE